MVHLLSQKAYNKDTRKIFLTEWLQHERQAVKMHLNFLWVHLYTVRTAPIVIPYSFHHSTQQKLATENVTVLYKWHEFKCDLCCKLLCVEAQKAVQLADGESIEPFSSSTVCLIQKDCSQTEVAIFFKSRSHLGKSCLTQKWTLNFEWKKKT